ncbi:MAG TPA: hypothetical protein VFX49_05490 [Chloroflexota bacterium]|nr:hypothetical protein [Chloroflexota bacterium]
MDRQQTEVRRAVAEARLERAARKLKYLRDSALYGYQDEAAYRSALTEYDRAQHELQALQRSAVAA